MTAVLHKTRLLFPALLLCYSGVGLAQVKGRVVSGPNLQALPYAAVYLKTNSKGVHTDENGEFELDTRGITDDTLYIQSMGCIPLRIPLNRVVPSPVFTLHEAPTTLRPVRVGRQKVTTVWKGASAPHRGFIFGQMGGSIRREIALFIPNETRQVGYLSKIGFYVTGFGKPKTPFRVRVYEPEREMPGQDLLTENVVTHAAWPHNWCFIDVSRYNISFTENGIFVAMEWLMLPGTKYNYTVKSPGSGAVKTFYGQQIGLTNEFDDLMGRLRVNNGSWQPFTAGYASPMIKVKIDLYGH